MIGRRRRFWIKLALCAAALLLAGRGGAVQAQWGGLAPSSQFELSEAVQLDQADNAVLAQLERVKTLLADRQWDEAVELLRQLPETSEGKLLAAAPRRYIGLGDWCQLQLAALPSEALRLYRGRVDPVAKQWYERGVAQRDRHWLQKVVDQAFASSYGDRALMALGDMALESGDYAAARWNWERIVPNVRATVQLSPQLERPGARGQWPEQANPNSELRTPKFLSPSAWPAYPDTKLDLAAVRARLVLASILEAADGKSGTGSLSRNGPEAGTDAERWSAQKANLSRFSRARAELVEFARLHPDAQGRLGQHEGRYVELLETLLTESTAWPEGKGAGVRDQGSDAANQQSEIIDHQSDWPTFAGNPRRNKIAPQLTDVGAVAWRIPLISPLPKGEGTVGENSAEPLSFHPLAVGDLVLVNNDRQILAVRQDTGKPAWGKTAAIYQAELAGVAGPPTILPDALGSPCFTMTVFQGRLLARMGPALTGQPQDATAAVGPGYLVCLDLAAQGRLLWKIAPEEGWTFEGSPVANEHGVYVAMRRQDIRPQAVVACFEADTGRLRWRRFICGAETPSRGVLPEYTHNLLTLSGGVIYYNTNLGAVAAVRTDDGRVLWISLYPRALRGDLSNLAPHWRRDLNPCVLDRGTLLVAPADSPRIFAFDAPTGQPLWQTGSELEDAAYLLGTAGDWLLAGGGRLYWISLRDEDRGRVKHVWPDGPDRPGYGRGVLAGQSVLWPTRDKLYIFDQQTARLRKAVDLAAHGAGGGNLLVTRGGQLLIVTESELIALGPYGGRTHGSEKLTIANCKLQIANLPSAICNLQFAIPNLQFSFGTTGCIRCLNTMIFKPYKS